MEHSVSSRSPSGQWYPQQQQQTFQSSGSPPQQWSPVSGTGTPVAHMGGGQPMAVAPAGGGSATLGNSGMLSSSSANLWAQQQQQPPGMTPQQQLMLMQSMYTSQTPCCASCCGTQPSTICPQPGEPVDPFCCTPREPGEGPRWWERVYEYFDWSFFLACVLCLLAIIGFVLVMVTRGQDDIFDVFGVNNTRDLDHAMDKYIPVRQPITASALRTKNALRHPETLGIFSEAVEGALVGTSKGSVGAAKTGLSSTISQDGARAPEPPCTKRRLLGSFGVICMEENLFANTFAVQLSGWTNARDTLWILAMVYSLLTVVYAVLINVRRHASAAAAEAQRGLSSTPPSITLQQQEEFVKMTPQQQQAFIQEYQQQAATLQSQSPSAPSPPHQLLFTDYSSSARGIEFYETPFYEFVRIAWFVSGLTAFAWAVVIAISFWSFSDFYIRSTEGPLRSFWQVYTRKMSATLVVVTVFLAWPLFNFLLELLLFVALVVPWLVIRSTCKRGIQMYRPALPLSKVPAYIRADMFFMDFQDVKRLGFSRLGWIILTGSDKPFFEGCEDPTVDKDPAMTQLMQQRFQWQQMVLSMVPMWMQSPPPQQQQMALMSPGGMGGMMLPGQMTPRQRQLDPNLVATPPVNSVPQSPVQYPVEDVESKSHKRRRHRSSHDRRHADPLTAAPMEQTPVGNGTAGRDNSTRHRHRHRRRSRSRSRSHSKSKGAFDNGLPQPPSTEAAVNGGAVPTVDGAPRRRHHHSHSRSRSKEVASMRASPVAVSVLPAMGESPSGGHRHRSHSHNKAPGDDVSAADVAGGRGTGGTTHNAGPAAASPELDALLQL
ncbi:hypothetical protein LSCM1_07735 [Leishmania martiniquensis]|uniref:Uncharacterized protein n=1 Tax=Leishmania martiniquensis TaxID=1580590 RepID=A0A836HMY1_9TRYP|nr:hypothetical protein LSCM1_07735 [Leishmania martiniquensis]